MSAFSISLIFVSKLPQVHLLYYAEHYDIVEVQTHLYLFCILYSAPLILK